ncbi:SGNH/GDSL hydrolase family protein [Roseibacillus persicicus]|uniref:SGNH hydrolase-type esterase domain-containing protein n=1 Tax=Roseibacillus persicicus TaxID=454148 RepID=A0A918TQH5_9BACT|nr:SGNH/GDSL hydrolase family protein [Roseibacillus persicicus]GHC57403.1 hypothetical protein GCM10007100_25450 [Roseibacillus persicicus]
MKVPIPLLLGTIVCLPLLYADDTVAIDAELQKVWPNNRTVNIVFHGHSVPSGYHLTPRVKPFESYPHLFRVAMAERYQSAVFNVITTSIGGENAVAGAARFETDVLPHRPDLIFIDYALNDRPLPIADVETAWRSMIASAKNAGIPLVLITPTGASNADFTDPDDPLTIRAELIRTLAEEEDVMLADVSAAWQEELDAGTAEGALLSQGNHPNLTGHQLAADEIYETYLRGLSDLTSVGTSDFPIDGSTNTFTTEDGLVTFTTTNTFSGQGNFFGDSGGSGNKVNSYDGDETLQVNLAADTQLHGFSLRWTTSDIHITGLADDPGVSIATVNGAAGVSNWDAVNKVLTLSLPWDNGEVRAITFANPAVSYGNNLEFSFSGANAANQASFVSFEYQQVDNGAGARLSAPAFEVNDQTITFPVLALRGHEYALEASQSLLAESWQTVDNLGPLAQTEAAELSDSLSLHQRRFYRMAVTYPQ